MMKRKQKPLYKTFSFYTYPTPRIFTLPSKSQTTLTVNPADLLSVALRGNHHVNKCTERKISLYKTLDEYTCFLFIKDRTLVKGFIPIGKDILIKGVCLSPYHKPYS